MNVEITVILLIALRLRSCIYVLTSNCVYG